MHSREETNIHRDVRACHHIHAPSNARSHWLHTLRYSKWKAHSCSLYREAVTVGELIKAHTAQVPNCRFVCVSERLVNI